MSSIQQQTVSPAADQLEAEVILSATDVSKKYEEGNRQTTVLDKLCLTVKRGDMIAICGASGSGKSTLLHLLGGAG